MSSSSHSTTKLISVVVPCFNEEAVIRVAHKRLVESLSTVSDIDYELIFIDDGSADNTLCILRELQLKSTRTRVIALSRNFGHQMALTAGLEHSRGDAVVTIDADLQDPPEVIIEMVSLWRRGIDVVYGQREERRGETPFKIWTAKAFYHLMSRLADLPLPLGAGDFRLMDRAVVNALLRLPERARFVRGMVTWVGFRQEPVRYNREARFGGTTKYPLRKMIALATDGIVSYSIAPLRLAFWTGLFTSLLAFLGIAYAIVMRLATETWVPGWTLLFIAVLFLGGVQLASLGIIGEYIGRSYDECKRRPLYIIREKHGFDSKASVTESSERCPD